MYTKTLYSKTASATGFKMKKQLEHYVHAVISPKHPMTINSMWMNRKAANFSSQG